MLREVVVSRWLLLHSMRIWKPLLQHKGTGPATMVATIPFYRTGMVQDQSKLGQSLGCRHDPVYFYSEVSPIIVNGTYLQDGKMQCSSIGTSLLPGVPAGESPLAGSWSAFPSLHPLLCCHWLLWAPLGNTQAKEHSALGSVLIPITP